MLFFTKSVKILFISKIFMSTYKMKPLGTSKIHKKKLLHAHTIVLEIDLSIGGSMSDHFSARIFSQVSPLENLLAPSVPASPMLDGF